MDGMQFRFRKSEAETLKILLGDFGLLERHGQPSELLLRLKEAGMVVDEELFEGSDIQTYFLTPEAKQVIRKALG